MSSSGVFDSLPKTFWVANPTSAVQPCRQCQRKMLEPLPAKYMYLKKEQKDSAAVNCPKGSGFDPVSPMTAVQHVGVLEQDAL